MSWSILASLTCALLLLSIPPFLNYLANYGNNATLLPDLRALGLTPTFYHAWGLFINFVPAVVFLLGGLIIAWRKPNDPMVLLTAALLISLVNIFPSISIMGTQEPGFGFIVNLLNVVGVLCLMFFGFTFPTGDFRPTWTRPFGIGATLTGGLGVLILPRQSFQLLQVTVALSLLIVFIAVSYTQLYRWQRSTPMRRQQTRWVLFGLLVTTGNLIVFFTINGLLQLLSAPSHIGLLYSIIYGTIACVGMALIPLTIGFSVLRYRLWEIDFFINQTLMYGLLTGILTLAYVAGVLVIQQLALTLTGIPQSSWAIAISTLVIAGLFQPIRHALQRRIEQRFNTPEEVIPQVGEAGIAALNASHSNVTHRLYPLTSTQLEDPLSLREIEVLKLIAQGNSNQEIADKLYITEGTVKRHATNIYGKLGVRSRTQAVGRGRELGLID